MRPFGGADAFAWSPDSKSLVYVSRKLKGMEYVFSTDSQPIPLQSGGREAPPRSPKACPDTTPIRILSDGRTLAWLSMPTAKFERRDKKRLMVMDMTSRQMRDLTENWDYWPENIAWAPGGKKIFFAGYYEEQRTGVQHRCGDMRNRHTIVNEQADFSGIHPVRRHRVSSRSEFDAFPQGKSSLSRRMR